FQAPASGSMRISGMDQNFDGQIAVYDVTNCSVLTLGSFDLVAANDDEIGGSGIAPNFTVCGLTPGSTYYLMHDSRSTTATGVYSIALSEIDLNAGTSPSLTEVCSGDTLNLYNTITGYDAGGTFTDLMNTSQLLNDTTFATTVLAFSTFNFEYRLTDGCAYDSIISQVKIYGPSLAGDDGSVTVCKNQTVVLADGLTGTIDLGGTWYNPSNNAISGNSITAANIPGNYNYTYITSNG
ncbi:MAG: hypothetical protein ITG04_06225, partial [Proteiniphilum sp.]|nr:hypothetical protein [Proteiniphilum sp.]